MASTILQGYGVFSKAPLIIHIFQYQNDIYPVLEEFVAGLGSTTDVTFLITSAWSFVSQINTNNMHEMLRKYRAFRRRYPQASPIYLANDNTELALYKQFGVESVLFQQNAFLSPEKYKRMPGIERKSGPIYVARLERYKRVELMEDLDDAVLVSASVDTHYYRDIKHRISKVKILNGDPDSDDYRVLDHMETLDAIQASTVGLCLSEVEGAMFGAAEYMLRGLPVVSTYSIGGRDTFSSDRYWRFCEPDAAAVRSAVDEMSARSLPPEEIAAHAKLTILKMRVDLVSYLWNYYRDRAMPNTFFDRLLDCGSDYVWTARPVAEVLAGL